MTPTVPGSSPRERAVSRRTALQTLGVAALPVAGSRAAASRARQPGSGAADAAWSRRYRHDPIPGVDDGEMATRANDVVPTADGGYLLAGLAGGDDVARAWLARTDEFGRLRWQRTVEERGRDWFEAAVATPDGGALLAGGAGEPLDGSLDAPNAAWVVRVDADGDEQWRRRYAGDDSVARDVARTDDGSVVVGSAGPPDAETGEAWVAALDRDGSPRWQRRFDPEPGTVTHANAVRPLADGGVLVGGSTGYPTPGEAHRDEAWLARLTADGETVWERTVGGPKGDRVEAMVAPADGGDGAVVLGNRGYAYDDDGAAWLRRVDGDGTERWSRAYEREGWEWAHDVAATDTGGYAIAGTRDGPDGVRRGAWLQRTDATGRDTWGKRYYEGDAGRVESVLAVGDGEFVLAGDVGGVEGAAAWLLDVGGTPVSSTGITQDLSGAATLALGIAVGLVALRLVVGGDGGED